MIDSLGFSYFIIANLLTKKLMPLTSKGKKIKKAMEKTYGKQKGKKVFYAMENSGKLKGVAKRKHK